MTQDIGTAIKRFEDYPKSEKQIYTVGNEQDYHFKVLFKIKEIPIIFKDREIGESKMSINIFYEAFFGILGMKIKSLLFPLKS